MLPVLQAEERLRFIDDVAAGTGALTKESLRGHLRSLREMARLNEEVTPATGDDLARMGIQVERVPVEG